MFEILVVPLARQVQESLSHQKIARDLMTPDEVGNMKRHECLVRIANMPVFKAKNTIPLSIQTGST